VQLADKVVEGETTSRAGDAGDGGQNREWIRQLTIPAVDMSDDTAYTCTVRSGQYSNDDVYRFSIVRKSLSKLPFLSG